jgi:hypothetical protein
MLKQVMDRLPDGQGVLGFLGFWFMLLIWAKTASFWHCILVFLLCVLILPLIASGIFEVPYMKRIAWVDKYFRQEGRLHRLLSRGTIMLVVSFLLSLGLTLVLLIQSLIWSGWVWVILLLDAWFLYVLRVWMQEKLSAEVNPEFLPTIARQFTLWLNVVILTLALVVSTLLTPQTDYRGKDIDYVLEVVSQHELRSCALVNTSERAFMMSQETVYWFMQNVFGDTQSGGMIALFAWVLLLLKGTVYSWAYTRALLGINALFPGKNSESENT